MVRSVAGDLPEQVKNNQSVNMAAGNGGQEISQYSWFTVYDKKHSIEGIWKKLKPYLLKYSKGTDKLEYIEVIEDYCLQVHKLDSDANKFRYPMTNTMQVYFPQNKRFDFVHVGNFFEALNNILDEIDSELNYRNEIEAEMEAEYRAEMTAEQDHYW